jgi:hypothetical protein
MDKRRVSRWSGNGGGCGIFQNRPRIGKQVVELDNSTTLSASRFQAFKVHNIMIDFSVTFSSKTPSERTPF